MPYYHSLEARESDPHALPDVEVFQESGEWFFAYGFPGCLYDSEPVGPFETEEEALEAARDTFRD